MRSRARREPPQDRASPVSEAERGERIASNDEGTLPPPSSNRGEVAVLSADAALRERAQRALRGKGFWVVVADSLSKLATPLPNDVLVLDPGDDRLHVTAILDVLARVPTRPMVVLVLRHADDLRLAAQFSVGAIGIDEFDDLLADAIERARSNRRRPRM